MHDRDLLSNESVRVEFVPEAGEPTDIPVSRELLDFLKTHGVPVGKVDSDRPRYVIYRVARPLKLSWGELPQPLLQLLLSLVAGYGDGRLVQTFE